MAESICPKNLENVNVAKDFAWKKGVMEPVILRGKDKEHFNQCVNAGDLYKNICKPLRVTLSDSSHPQLIYIRKSYTQFRDKIVECLNKSEEDIYLQRIISGTPRIGKSTLLSFLLSEIPKSTQIKRIVVVCERRNTTVQTERIEHQAQVIYYNSKCRQVSSCKDDTILAARYCFESFTLNDLQQLQRDSKNPENLIIMDGFRMPPTFSEDMGNFLLFSSQGITKGVHMRSPKVPVWYMSVWDQKELQHFKEQKCDIPLVKSHTIPQLMSLFGGAIGYMVDEDIEANKKVLYDTLVRRHVKACELPTPTDDAAVAAIVKVVPFKDDWSFCYRFWLTPNIAYTVQWLLAYMHSLRVWQSLYSLEGSLQGALFEEYLGLRYFLKPNPMMMEIYKNYKENTETKWYKEDTEMVDFKFTHPPRLINWKGNIFPMRFHVMHRLSVASPSVDFYYVKKNDDNTRTVYLIQATVASRHSANFKEVFRLLKKMEESMESTEEVRKKLALLKTANDEKSLRDLKDLKGRYSNRYALGDIGEDLETTLSDAKVNIVFLYVQMNLDTKFNGDVSKVTAKSPDLLKKLQCEYAVVVHDGHIDQDDGIDTAAIAGNDRHEDDMDIN